MGRTNTLSLASFGAASIISCWLIPLVSTDVIILDAWNKTIEVLISYQLTYTSSIPDQGIFGMLEMSQPPDACTPVNTPPIYPTNGTDKWFLLAYRSSFSDSRCQNRIKIQNAINAGYKAVILYSRIIYYQSATFPSYEDLNLSIPAVLVSHDDGEKLQNFLYRRGYKILLTPDSYSPGFSYYLIPFIVVIGAGALLLIAYVAFHFMVYFNERRKAQRHRLPKKYLKQLTMQKYEKGIFYETCAICLDDYIEGEKIRILPCNHAYHMKCIDPWLTKNRRVCPTCKAKVTLPGMEEYSDSDSDGERRAQASNNDNANERTRLLPSSHYSNTRNSNRSSSTRPLLQSHRPTRSNRSSTRYDLLDDSLIQPGPSTSSAPSAVPAELPSTTADRASARRKERKRRAPRGGNVQVVVAEVTPLLAPPQLSINCGDSESERAVTPPGSSSITANEPSQPPPPPQVSVSSAPESGRTTNEPANSQTSVDQIV